MGACDDIWLAVIYMAEVVAVLVTATANLHNKVKYHANAKYENPLQITEKNTMSWLKANVSNNKNNNTLPCYFF